MNYTSFINIFDFFASCYVYGCLTYILLLFSVELYNSLLVDCKALDRSIESVDTDFYSQVKNLLNPSTESILEPVIVNFELMTIRELRTYIKQNQQIANSTSIPNVSAALEESGFKPDQDPWIAVDSSCIDAIAHLQTESALKIRFNSGCIYQYENVSHNAFVNFLNADSKGRFFNRNIKDAYPYRQL
jgi:KTSC domain